VAKLGQRNGMSRRVETKDFLNTETMIASRMFGASVNKKTDQDTPRAQEKHVFRQY
jgi:hypothetical protein